MSIKEESFSKLESMNCELEDLKDMVVLMEENCFKNREERLNDNEVREKYRTAQTMTMAIFRLLNYQIKDSNNFIKQVYEERKNNKEVVA